jgi:hypothetical protein
MRILRTPLVGLFLLGLAVAVAMLVSGQSGARPTAAATPTPVPPVTGADYKCYGITGSAPVVAPVNLQTSFGLEEGVEVGDPMALCLPAGKNSTQIPDVPHLKCYSIEGTPPGANVNLLTQFGIEKGVEVGEPWALCVPAGKAIYNDPAPAPEAEPFYKCYTISGSAPSAEPVSLTTQFGTEPSVEVGVPAALCKPALMNGQGTLNAPELKCYVIPGVAPDKIVNLQTQWSTESNVTVGPPLVLCVPARGTGGIAELPALAGTSAEEAATPAESSGWSAGAYAALAAGLAAAAVVIGAGGWYARRRFIKS